MTPDRYTQQSVEAELGEYVASRNCAPTCFYMLGRAGGYMTSESGPSLNEFTASLDWDANFSEERGWVRPKLAEEMRGRYGMEVVSWQLNGAGEPDIEKMRAAGYLSSDREVEFFREQVVGHELEEIVHNTYPVIVGVRPGFGGESRSTHAIILAEWADGQVTVVDPDDRNNQQVYSEEYLRQYLNPSGGGCTVVLPKEAGEAA